VKFRQLAAFGPLRGAAWALALGLLAGDPAAAQNTDWNQVAVPNYSPASVLQGLHQHWTLPRADDFARQAQGLPVAVKALCEAQAPAGQALAAARGQWQSTAHAWERLSAVAIGPLVARRSQRQIDFSPTRPGLIEKAIESGPGGAQAMERIGTPAKGLPALEWLLWTRPAAPGSAACRYAGEVALDVEREALALQREFQALAGADWPAAGPDKLAAGVGELVNQWVGGLERLRWAQMEKPLRAAKSKGGAPEWPRAASRQTAASWAAQWEALRSLGLATGGAQVPLPGQGLVPLETYLRGKGAPEVADALAAAGRQADLRLQKITRGPAPAAAAVLEAGRALARLKRVAEGEVAPALDVGMGFSDADGD